MLIRILALGMFETNCYLLAADEGDAAAVVDPVDDAPFIKSSAEKLNLNITHILLTHGHFDHILALKELKDLTQATVCIHSGDAEMLKSEENCLASFVGADYQPCEPDVLLEDGQQIKIGALTVQALHTPGHTPGGLTFHVPALKPSEKSVAFTGDALFRGAIGRTDLAGGDEEQLLRGIREKIFTLPEDTILFPGHGPDTTVGFEKKNNPFFNKSIR